ncbi:TetR/AcrR family transcriptional regulator [Epilithonimonas zeae]|uniref:TetR/AcrR family transcriptional regulator n=1 Tax=Epilithonimonas zeae TaxID=1416779 RepID=UPI00293F515E|nr:TetR/AcrR family transcriptional regulator [Epilithonimonas zeae]
MVIIKIVNIAKILKSMMEENTKPRVKSKEKSKQQFMDAVGTILKTKGYKYLKVNEIAATAGLDKKLIYNYFGGTEQLLDEYIKTQDFWSNVKEEDSAVEITDGGKEFAKQMMSEQFDFVSANKELKKILLWRLSEERTSLRKLTEGQEENGEILFKHITDPYFEDKSEDFRAVMAILVSGAYYLNLYSEMNGSIFCGIDLKTEDGREKIKKAFSFLIDETYETLK